MIQTAIFKRNNAQVVEIPKAMEFPKVVKKVCIVSVGNALLITPADMSWDSWFDGDGVTADFMNEREQPTEQVREIF